MERKGGISMKLKGKVGIITGGASGLGREFCTELVKEGAKVAAVDLDKRGADETVETIKREGGEAVSIETDVTDPSHIAQMTQTVLEENAKIDILCNNAGIEYTAAKHGVVGLTKQLSYEYGHDGVRVVAIAPGVIQGTAITKDITVEGGPFHELTMNAPAGRYGKAIEVARLVVFLASDDASFIHGNTIPVEGGSTIL